MYGRQHLQMLTGEFEREAETMATASITTNHVSNTEPQAPSGAPEPLPAETTTCCPEPPLDIPQFTEMFLEQNLNREIELRELRRSVVASQERHLQLAKQMEELKDLLQKVESDMSSVKNYGASLTAQLNSLRMVPTLFGVINF